LVTLAAYLPAARNDFIILDDNDYVTQNPVVQQGLTLAGVKWAATTFHSANWHPLTWFSHMTDCELFGLNAGAHHLVNALFHAANTALLFLLLWRLTESALPSLLVAALFGWHPLHVESVAWVAERKDVLSTFCGLLALLSHAKFAREKHRRSYWLALVFFALGLLAKPMLVTLPFLLLLLDFWPLRRFSWGALKGPLLREKIPFFALAAGSCVVTYFAQSAGHALTTLDRLPLSYRLENALVSVAAYLSKLGWPTRLAIYYPQAPIPTRVWVLAGAVLLLISCAVWLARNRSPCWLFGWLRFVGMLVPVIGLVQVGGATMADRYAYLPSVGLFAAVVFGLHGGCGRWPGARNLLGWGLLPPLVACLLVTERQLSYWRDSETLFRHALAVTKNNYAAHEILAVILELQGRYAEALTEYREVVRIDPAHYQMHLYIGEMLEKTGHPAEALDEIRQCLIKDPDQPILHCAAGRARAALGDFAAAKAEFAEAERLNARDAEPHLNLAEIHLKRGEDALAAEELRAAAQAEPHDINTLLKVARDLATNTNSAPRDTQDALALALKANDLSKNNQPDVFDVLGMAFAANGDFSNAVVCAQNALEFTPANNRKDAQSIQERLELYQKQQPWRQSFRATNAPPP
jgi:tetratricopeptide (TPR) repeat protein